MICSAEHTHTDMHTHTILLCAPTRAAELFAAERDKVLSVRTGVDSDVRLRVHQVYCGDTVLFVNCIIPGRWKARGTCMQPGACSDVQHLPPRVINNGRRTRAVYLEKVVCYLSGFPVSRVYRTESPSPPPSRFLFGIPSPSPFPPPPLPFPSTPPPPRQRHQVVQMPPRLQVTGRCTAREALSALVERQMCHPNSPNPKFPKPSCKRTGRRIDTDPSRTLAS